MKEASGELNLTVVVVMAVAALMAFFYTLIWPTIRNNMASNTKCQAAVCKKCEDSDGCSTVDCTYTDKKGNKTEMKCVWKG